MNKNFIKQLCEDAMATTEVALNVDNISTDIQAMIKKITTIKTETLSNLVKKIKYDGNIEQANQFEQNIGQKLDQLLQSMTDIKGEIDNISVGLLNGTDTLDTNEPADIDSDFEEFSVDGEENPSDDTLSDVSDEPTDDTEDFSADLGELDREMK